MNPKTIFIFLAVAVILAGLVIELIYILRTGRYIRGILLGWGLWSVGYLIVIIILPWIAITINSEYAKLLQVPDAPGFLILVGWAPALFIAIIALFVQCIIEWLFPPKPTTNEDLEQPKKDNNIDELVK